MPKTQRSPPETSHTTTPVSHDNTAPCSGSDSDLNLISTDQDNFSQITKRAKLRLTNKPGKSDEVLNEFRLMFEKIQSNQETKYTALNSSINTILEQNLELQKKVDLLSSRCDTLVNKLEAVESDNKQLKTQIKSLDQKLETLERDARSTSIEIRNVPSQEHEDKSSLYNTVKIINSAIGCTTPVQESEIRNIYRNKTKAILVDFTTSSRKEELIQKYKQFSKEQRLSKQSPLSTANLNIPGPTKTIYLSEALTTKARRVFYLARELVKDRKVVAAWTSYGKVLIKLEENKPPLRVFNEEELACIVSNL